MFTNRLSFKVVKTLNLKRQTELHYVGWVKNNNKWNLNRCHHPLITQLSGDSILLIWLQLNLVRDVWYVGKSLPNLMAKLNFLAIFTAKGKIKLKEVLIKLPIKIIGKNLHFHNSANSSSTTKVTLTSLHT